MTIAQASVFEWFCCFNEGGMLAEKAKHPKYLPTSRNNDSVVEVYDFVQSDRTFTLWNGWRGRNLSWIMAHVYTSHYNVKNQDYNAPLWTLQMQKKCTQIFDKETSWKVENQRSKNLTDISLGWNKLAQHHVQWQASALAVLKLHVPHSESDSVSIFFLLSYNSWDSFYI